MKSFGYLTISVLILAGCMDTPENPEVTENELFDHLSYLASDSLKGRMPGSPEDRLAALYIASEFKKAGLRLLSEEGLQAFEVITSLEKGNDNSLSFMGQEYETGSDFDPFPFTGNTSLEADVVFTGYGFEIDRNGLHWNDYEGRDVTGKWVMVLRGNPEIDSTGSVFHEYSNERDKAMVALDHGAGGILFVSGPVFSKDDPLIDLQRREGKIDIPAIHISRDLADRILEASGRTIKSLEEELNLKRKPVFLETGLSLKASAEVKPATTTTYNVVAYLEGNDPQRKEDYIIIGAHYDHLGMGGPGSSSRKPDTTGVHNGADDNASGIAALIEIAEKLAGIPDRPSNSYVFIAFGAEEMGLLGSKYYADNPLLPLDHARMMINMDMVGRLRDRQVQVGGVGTALESEDIVLQGAWKDSLRISTTREGYGASDHSSFYAKDLPVLFVTTGAHTDYHTPEDDVDRINLEGMVRISNYVSDIAMYVDQLEEPLTFQEAGPKVQYAGRRSRRIALGIMPDFTDNDDSPGMRVDFVTPGKPAHKGGMQKGDFIMAIEGKPINGIYDYMYRLSKCSKGQIIVVTVAREEQTLDLLIQL
jgi:hypothetical protein